MNLLYELQNCYKAMEESKNVIKDGSHLYFLKKMKKEFEQCKVSYNKKVTELTALKAEYVSISKSLKEIKSKIDTDESDLYNKYSSDMKSINAIQNKIASNKTKLRLLEDKAIELLELEEKLKMEMENLKLELINVKNNFYSYKKDTSEKISAAKANVESLNEKIAELSKVIPKKDLDAFNTKYKTSKNVVAKVYNGICDGCKMKVSAVTLDKLSKGEDIIYCDNCGRMLVKEDEKILKKAK